MVQKLKVKTMRTIDMQQEEPCTDELISISGDSRQCPRLSEAVGVHSKTTLRGNLEKKCKYGIFMLINTSILVR